MDQIMRLTIVCLLIIIIGLFYKNRRDKRAIYTFSDELEKTLNDMLSEKEISVSDELQESLWGKISTQLLRLQQIWQVKEAEGRKERELMKELVSDISHQTKTPIANLKMYCELLQDSNIGEEQQREFVEKIESQTNKLDFLIQSMVKMSRLETGIIEIKKKENRLYQTLGRAVAAAVSRAEKKQIEIHVDCFENIRVRHDGKWTEEAIFNILENAVKYTQSGGKIWIRAEKGEFFMKLAIRDNGKGIARERQAEIFKRFYREPEVHDKEGVGVGLYLAREIIQMQGGYIEVHSQEGKGAEFQLYLPNEAE